jgi:hypothetical protein
MAMRVVLWIKVPIVNTKKSNKYRCTILFLFIAKMKNSEHNIFCEYAEKENNLHYLTRMVEIFSVL